MGIFEKIDGIIKILDIPFWDGMPTFSENEEPPLYIVYSLYDNPILRGDGVLDAISYNVTINIIGVDESEVDEIQKEILSLFENYDFVYQGSNYQHDSDLPKRIRRIMDFTTVIEREENNNGKN